MQLNINSKKLLNNLNRLKQLVGTKSQLKILQNITLEAINNDLVITGDTLDNSIHIVNPVIYNYYNGVVKITINYKKLLEIVNKLSKKHEVIILESDNQNLNIIAENKRFSITLDNLDDYPDPVTIDSSIYNNHFLITYDNLSNIISKLINFTSKDELKYSINGMNINFTNDNQLHFISTDANRISLIKADIEDTIIENINPDKIESITLNKIFLKAFKTAFKSNNKNEILKVYYDNHHIKVINEYENISIYTKLIDGCFPDYPLLFDNIIVCNQVFNKKELLDSLDDCLLVNKSTEEFPCYLAISKEITRITSYDTCKESKFEGVINSIDNDIKDDNELYKISVNTKYIMESLKYIEGDNITFKFIAKNKPFILTPENNDNILNIIMPLKD